MKDSILNSILIVATFAALLAFVIDFGQPPQAATGLADRAPTIDNHKTFVASDGCLTSTNREDCAAAKLYRD